MTQENRPNQPQESQTTENSVGEARTDTNPTALETRDERLQRIKAAASKNKKRMVIVCVAVVVGIALLFGLVTLIDYLSNRPPKIPEYDFYFYPTYQGDIMSYEPYVALDRQVYYCEDPLGDGLKTAVNEENMTDYDMQVLFLYLYLQTIIEGNVQTYNSYFNDTYYKKSQPLTSFSPQMLYDMEIIYQGTESQAGGEKLVSYRISYRIHRNDGTFRRDVDSDASRPQTITLRVGADGEISIERLVTHYTVVKS